LTELFNFAIFKKYPMDRDFLIKLTNNLYRLTLLFPKKEPLRYKMREVADDILAEQSPLLALEYLGVLDSFFEVAKSQNWVAAQDVLNLQAEYSKLDGELRAQPSLFGINTLRPMPEPIVAEKPQMADSLQLLPERQEKILSFCPKSPKGP
jgi:hypothetical protein